MRLIPARKIDRDSLCLLMESSTDGTPFKIRRQVERIRKAFERGQLFIPPHETEQQKWWRCEARMMLGEYSDWRGWEYRDEWAATLWHWRDTRPFDIEPWNGLSVDCLYVIGEQGIGDEVFFASCLHECTKRAKRVVVETLPRLQSVFERSFGVETVPSQVVDGRRQKRELPAGVSAWISLGDLPRMFRLSLDSFPGTPYLKPDIEQVRRFDQYRGCTGISWRGAQGSEQHIPQAFPDALSLQYDKAWNEDAVEVPGLDMRNDIEGVLGLLANLDRVVTVSTSVAHFACAMGVPTDVIIANPKTAMRGNIFPFKWICRATPGKTPWYGSARVYANWMEYEQHNLHCGTRPKPERQKVGGAHR